MEYHINKGINKPLEFKGLKAQYIGYLAVGLVSLLVAFAVMYIIGVPLVACMVLTGGGGAVLYSRVYRLSHTHGEHGLLKAAAYGRVPDAVISNRLSISGIKEKRDKK